MEPPIENRLTLALNHLLQGEGARDDEVFALVYRELRALAGRHMGRGPGRHTLQPTALVNEAWLRLTDGAQDPGAVCVESRRQFFALASKAMRSVLVDHARAVGAEKRGGGRRPLTLETSLGARGGADLDVLALEEALERLQAQNPELASIVELRFYAGLGHDEISAVTGVPLRTVERRWRLARAWLYRELSR